MRILLMLAVALTMAACGPTTSDQDRCKAKGFDAAILIRGALNFEVICVHRPE